MRIYNFLKGLVSKALSLIYHDECAFCNDELPLGKHICDKCMSEVKGKKFIRKTPGGFDCISAFKYRDKYKNSVLRFKFAGKTKYSFAYANIILSNYYDDLLNFDADYITFVPLMIKSYKKRGYNQAELIAKDIAFLLKKSYNNILCKTKSNSIQHTLNRNKRSENVKGVYSVNNKYNLQGKRIIICDDIVTTGWTLNECAVMLIKSGASQVMCITAADVS